MTDVVYRTLVPRASCLTRTRPEIWEIIADNLSKAGWSWGFISAVDCYGRRLFFADAHRNGRRFIVRADESLTAFLELESAIRERPTAL